MAVGMNAAQPEAWRLTARQREVLRLVAQARSDKEIAPTLGLSENTVGQHLDRIFKRLGIHSRLAAVLQLGAQQEPKMSPVRDGQHWPADSSVGNGQWTARQVPSGTKEAPSERRGT
jgi:DNA-binding CsgD family transcriptional regulator